ncbi:transcription initiation factor TFIID subunit [Trifolium repens]|nr:transcription initiation factor TFIID subunit [Trifolium repens]
MESQPPVTGTTARNAAEPSQPQPQQPPPSSLPSSSSSTPPISTPSHPSPIPNPNLIQTQNPKPPTSIPPQSRPPPSFTRNPTPPQSHYSHFSSIPPSATPSPASSFPSTPSSSISSASAPRGGMAIGVPAHHQNPSPPFSSSFGQHFGGLGRSDSTSNSNTSQVRAPMQGMGMLGSLGSNSQMRPGGLPSHQQRPVQSSLRPPPSAQNNQPAGSQNFQGHGLMRPSSVGSPATPSPSASQSMQSINQPWLSSGPAGKPPLPSPAYRQQLNPPSLQQRTHISQQQQQQQQSMPTVSQQQQQQPLPTNQPQDHFGQQVPSSRALHVPHQPQVARLQGPGNQKPSTLVAAQSGAVQPGVQSRLPNALPNADIEESGKSVLSKRSIHELVNQVDPLEKLDPEVADILGDIAEDFLDSIIRSGCSLAKHRKSTTLEAKDILLHLEKNWNITLPGFGGDEIKNYRKPISSDIHKERLAAIKKSMVATEAGHTKGSAGQASGSAKGNQTKIPFNVIGSPNLKNS